MKKVILILTSFLSFGLIGSLILSFCLHLDVTVLDSAVLNFKIIRGLKIFTMIFPCMILSGFTLAFSIYFGSNNSGSYARFSPAMFNRFKFVMIISLVCVLTLTLSSEVFSYLLDKRQNTLITQPKLIEEYIRIGNNLLDTDRPSPAAVYADQALQLEKNNREAMDLKNRAEIAISLKESKSSRFLQEENIDAFIFTKSDSEINRSNLDNVFSLYQKAKNAWNQDDWFNAHYYAESAIKIASGKDVNLAELRSISADAWNNLTEKHNLVKSDAQDFFNQKYQGYKALIEEDYLKAYYIFTSLQMEDDAFKRDSDINFYTEIARSKVNEKAFFIDETFELKSFESANDICFSLTYQDGSTDIIYYKGVTSIKSAGDTIQYLRGLSIESFDPSGEFYRSMTVPYAKVLEISVIDMNPKTKEILGIDPKIKFVPYIMLQSIDRVVDGEKSGPVYEYANSEASGGPDFILLPISFNDFLLVESITRNPDLTPINSLFKLVGRANLFGYSSEVYGQVMLNRFLYPLYMLTVFILLAAISWNNRLSSDQFFKTIWLILFPIFSIICYYLDNLLQFLFKLMNYALYYAAGFEGSLIWGIISYILILVFASLFFVSRKAES